ncbi:MAG: hypothetical protein WBX18_13450, partial [Terracidiphilus sp.]
MGTFRENRQTVEAAKGWGDGQSGRGFRSDGICPERIERSELLVCRHESSCNPVCILNSQEKCQQDRPAKAPATWKAKAWLSRPDSRAGWVTVPAIRYTLDSIVPELLAGRQRQ